MLMSLWSTPIGKPSIFVDTAGIGPRETTTVIDLLKTISARLPEMTGEVTPDIRLNNETPVAIPADPAYDPSVHGHAVGIDWLTLRTVVDDTYPRIQDGYIISVNADGEVVFESAKRLSVEGSYDARTTVRTITDDRRGIRILEISGNPSKFWCGHNVWPVPSSEIVDVCNLYIRSALAAANAPVPSLLGWSITRIDLTAMCSAGSTPADALEVMSALQRRSRLSRRGASTGGHAETAYFGAGSSRWSCCAYLKAIEIKSPRRGHALHEAFNRIFDDIHASIQSQIRVEFRILSAELKRRGLSSISAWTKTTGAQLWDMYSEKIQINEVNTVTTQHLKAISRSARATLIGWQDGNLDMPKATFYRHRKQILDALGIDILIPHDPAAPATQPAVRLSKVIHLRPTLPPAWAYDHILKAA